ncbi:MAG TPA: hypothetical protein DDW90_08740 [Cyanobacteria bacterium UBA9971]|nr:hypothetical protein [Cyanobacteria bacterium UBA9971]
MDFKKYKVILTGLATYLPGFNHYINRVRKHPTISAKYCYTVWLRHLIKAYNNNLSTNPEIIAELGPGSSIGVGLAALISGAEKYYAFDLTKLTSLEKNIVVFDGLVELFKKNTNLAESKEFPRMTPYLDYYEFPHHILTSERLKNTLNEERLEKIRNSIMNPNNADSLIKYFAPWDGTNLIEKNTVDMIFSQAVLEHVENPEHVYKIQYDWLKNNGFMSHSIDFKSHGFHKEWDGHLTYTDFLWNIIKGRRNYSLNRISHSRQVSLIENAGFKLICEEKYTRKSNLKEKDYAKRFKALTYEDKNISESFILAQKF